jgi:hypothetical protein
MMAFSINVSRVSAKRTTHFQISHNMVAQTSDDASTPHNKVNTANGAAPMQEVKK